MQFGGTSFATTAPAATTDPDPTRTPGVIVAFAPIDVGLDDDRSRRDSVESFVWFDGVSSGAESDAGADHRTVPNGDAAEIVERAILVDEDPFAELQVEPVVALEGRVDR